MQKFKFYIIVITFVITTSLSANTQVVKNVSCNFKYKVIEDKKDYGKKSIYTAVANIIRGQKQSTICKKESLIYMSESEKIISIIDNSNSLTTASKVRLYLLLTQYAGVSTLETLSPILRDICYYEPEVVLNELAGISYYLEKEFTTDSYVNYLAKFSCDYPDSVLSSRTFNRHKENEKHIKELQRASNDGNEPIVFFLIKNVFNNNKIKK